MAPDGNQPAFTVIKQIVCLANSRKLQGRCIAGREIEDGVVKGWIRPVSSRPHEEVSEYERQYSDGSDPQVLDVINIPLISAIPKSHQQENWLLDPGTYWEKIGTLNPDQLGVFADGRGPLWRNGNSSYNGVNDYLTVEEAKNAGSSLKLIHLRNGLSLRVFSPGEAFGNPKRRVQANFTFSNASYQLWVTDPIIETAYLAQEDGAYALGSSYLTVSLGEEYDGRCYKLVAAIIGA